MDSKTKQRKKRSLLKRDGSFCWLCHNEFCPQYLTLDHVIPRSLGGTNELTNLKLACHKCNHDRGNTPPPNGFTTEQRAVIALNKQKVATKSLTRGLFSVILTSGEKVKMQ